MAEKDAAEREKGDYEPDPRQIRHVQETLQLLSVMTKDHRFEEAYNNDREGGPRTMCEVLDKVESRGVERGLRQGMQKGMQEGLREGEAKARREMALSLLGMGVPMEQVAQAAKVSVETLKQWLDAAK